MLYGIDMTVRELEDLVAILREVGDTGKVELPGDCTLVKKLQFALMAAEEVDPDMWDSGAVLQALAAARYSGYDEGFREGQDEATVELDDVREEAFEDGKNAGFEAGWDDGYAAARDEFEDSGYDSGYEDGYSDGYAEGYAQGLHEPEIEG